MGRRTAVALIARWFDEPYGRQPADSPGPARSIQEQREECALGWSH